MIYKTCIVVFSVTLAAFGFSVDAGTSSVLAVSLSLSPLLYCAMMSSSIIVSSSASVMDFDVDSAAPAKVLILINSSQIF